MSAVPLRGVGDAGARSRAGRLDGDARVLLAVAAGPEVEERVEQCAPRLGQRCRRGLLDAALGQLDAGRGGRAQDGANSAASRATVATAIARLESRCSQHSASQVLSLCGCWCASVMRGELEPVRVEVTVGRSQPMRPLTYLLGVGLFGRCRRASSVGPCSTSAPLVEEHRVVRDPHGLAQVVGDHDQGQRGRQGLEQCLDRLGRERVERRRRLVEQEHLGSDGQGAGQAEQLLLAAREPEGRVVEAVLDGVPQARPRSAGARPPRRAACPWRCGAP